MSSTYLIAAKKSRYTAYKRVVRRENTVKRYLFLKTTQREIVGFSLIRSKYVSAWYCLIKALSRTNNSRALFPLVVFILFTNLSLISDLSILEIIYFCDPLFIYLTNEGERKEKRDIRREIVGRNKFGLSWTVDLVVVTILFAESCT